MLGSQSPELPNLRMQIGRVVSRKPCALGYAAPKILPSRNNPPQPLQPSSSPNHLPFAPRELLGHLFGQPSAFNTLLYMRRLYGDGHLY